MAIDGWLQARPGQMRNLMLATALTADYSEASAINELGRATRLPTAVSGQNSEWW